MSLHPSLKVDTAGSQQRSVLSRIERIKDLMKKGLWEENQSVIGLPKIKVVKIKAKKKPKAEDEEGEAKTTEEKATAEAAPAEEKAK